MISAPVIKYKVNELGSGVMVLSLLALVVGAAALLLLLLLLLL